MLVVALGAIWIATSRLVNRHVRLLVRAARVYSRGDLSARPVLDRAPTELAELGRVFALMADRVAEREGELKASLAQKEGLIREIHHRVKNNLQIVASLLNLRLRSVREPEVRRALEEVQTRIKALALVHRSLYEQDEFGSIELQHFLGELAQLLIDGADPSAAARELEVRVMPTRVPTEKAMAIALLVTECVSSALQHAFPTDRDPTIRITLDNDGRQARLTIADYGERPPAPGPSGFPDGRAEAHGITLSRLLAKQIGGELRIGGPPGTEFSVSFAVDLSS
jgi:two-component sensor histidine kinase